MSLKALALVVVFLSLPTVVAGPQTVPGAGIWFADTFEADAVSPSLWTSGGTNGGVVTFANGQARLLATPTDPSKSGGAGIGRGSDAQALAFGAAKTWPPQEAAGVMLETTVTVKQLTVLFTQLGGDAYAAIEAGGGGEYLVRRGPADGVTSYTRFAPAFVPGHTYTLRLLARPDHTLGAAAYEGSRLLGSTNATASFGPSSLRTVGLSVTTGPINGWGSRTGEYLLEDVVVGPSALEALAAPLLPR